MQYKNNKKISIALHDVRVSSGNSGIQMISKLITTIDSPLTIHLICDTQIIKNNKLILFLIEKIKENKIEVVYHGVTHKCKNSIGKFTSFYHNYEAEFLENSLIVSSNTKYAFQNLKMILNQNLGICPPCWISTKENFKMLKSLNPLYVEKMIFIFNQKNKNISPVISLGSSKDKDLFLLKILGNITYLFTFIYPIQKVRLVFHLCDLKNQKSMSYFIKKINYLKSRNFKPVLLKDLLD